MTRAGHSRVTGVVRLVLAVWLMGAAVRTLADPQGAVAEQGVSMNVLLPLAGLSFAVGAFLLRSEEHTSELQSPVHLVCRLLLEKKKKNINNNSRLKQKKEKKE